MEKFQGVTSAGRGFDMIFVQKSTLCKGCGDEIEPGRAVMETWFPNKGGFEPQYGYRHLICMTAQHGRDALKEVLPANKSPGVQKPKTGRRGLLECYLCGEAKDVQIHHINWHHEENGSYNRLPLCGRCHTYIHKAGLLDRQELNNIRSKVEDREPERFRPTLFDL